MLIHRLCLGGERQTFCYYLCWIGEWVWRKVEKVGTYTFGECFPFAYEHDITFDEICVQCLQSGQ